MVAIALGIAITLVVLGFSLMGDGLRDALDVRSVRNGPQRPAMSGASVGGQAVPKRWRERLRARAATSSRFLAGAWVTRAPINRRATPPNLVDRAGRTRLHWP
ncbi:MAG: hypothetical protein U0Q12_19850 [Vicinamibacterales bacterium]